MRFLPKDLIGFKVIFKHTNNKTTDRFYKNFYGDVFDVTYDVDHSAVFCINQTQTEKFFLTDYLEMNATVLTPNENPEYFL